MWDQKAARRIDLDRDGLGFTEDKEMLGLFHVGPERWLDWLFHRIERKEQGAR